MGVLLRLATTMGAVAALHLLRDAAPVVKRKDDMIWLNDTINSYLVPSVFDGLSRELRTYVRNVIAGTLVYHVTAGLWALYIYVIRGKHFFPNETFPSRATIRDQIFHAQVAVFSYAWLPGFAAFCSERGYTAAYYYVSEVGWQRYVVFTAVYLVLVEIGIYWVHRILHTNKFLYNHVHLMHHKYNKANEMSPYASIAFHPLDGILQAAPYVLLSFVVPVHYITSLVLLFNTAIWATAIHDGVVGATEPLMGAAYHTAHHVYYTCNFGQFTVFCDKFWGTLRVPASRKQAA